MTLVRNIEDAARDDRAVALAVALVAAVYYTLYFNYGVSLGDEGLLVNGAMRILDGQTPTSDWYTPYPPGLYYLIAAAFGLFGPSMLVLKALLLSLKLLAAPMYYVVARRLLGRNPALLATMVYVVVPGAWHAVFMTLMPLLFLHTLFAYFDTRRTAYLVTGGFVCAAAMFIRQDTGVYMAAAGIVALCLEQAVVGKGRLLGPAFLTQRAAPFLLAALTILPALYAASGGQAGAVLEDMFFKPLLMESGFAKPFNKVDLAHGVRGLLSLESLIGFFFYVPPLVYAAVLVLLVVRFRRGVFGQEELRLTAVLAVAVLSFKSVVTPADVGHLIKAIPLSYILAAYLAERGGRLTETHGMAGRAGRAAALAVALVAVVYTGVFVFTGQGASYASGSIGRRFIDSVRLDMPRGGTYVPRALGEGVTEVAEYVKSRTDADDKVMAIPFVGVVGFLTGRGNPARYDYVMPGIIREDEQQGMCADSLKAEYIIYYQPEMANGYPRRPEQRLAVFAPELFRCLMQGFVFEAEIGNYLILRRAEGDHPETARLVLGRDFYLYKEYAAAEMELSQVPQDSPAYPLAKKYMGLARGYIHATH